jgi:hypothetical protein
MDNPEKLAQMLQQQQAMKFLQSLQGGANGQQSAMGAAERMQPNFDGMTQMPQEAAMLPESSMPIANPQGNYGMPMPQQSFSANTPTNPQMDRRGMLQGAINSLGQQSMGQSATNTNPEMMRRLK